MSGSTPGGEQPDLFDQWLAFHAGQGEDAGARATANVENAESAAAVEVAQAEVAEVAEAEPVEASAPAASVVANEGPWADPPPPLVDPVPPAPRRGPDDLLPVDAQDEPAGPVAEREPEPAPPPARTSIRTPPPQPADRRPAGHRAAADPPPLDVAFRPRVGGRLVIALALACALAAAVLASIRTWRDPGSTGWSITGTLWGLTAVIWAVHTGTSVTRMSVRGGLLHVWWHGTKIIFDLTSPLTPIEVSGTPGRHSWHVRILRKNLTPFVINSSMVDPHEFMRVLRYYRPELG